MRRILFGIVVGLGGAAILISLGVWQVKRLAWKEDLLARIEAQIADAPVSLGEATRPEFVRYAPVTLQGRFGEGHIRVLASRKQIGAVYRIIRPFEDDVSGRILVDTGWLRDGTPVTPSPDQAVTLTGNLDAPNEIDRYTPAPDLGTNTWFARDVPEMARTLDTEPLLVVLRDTSDQDLGVTAWPVDTRGIPNDHLQYAVTWFSLAAIWIAMSLYFLNRRPAKDAP